MSWFSCCYAECRDFLVMLNVVMLSVVMLNVMAPLSILNPTARQPTYSPALQSTSPVSSCLPALLPKFMPVGNQPKSSPSSCVPVCLSANCQPAHLVPFIIYTVYMGRAENTKGEVSLYRWPPVWLVWDQLYDNWQFLFYLQNRLIQTSQTGGQQYSNTSTFSIPWGE